jgi:hypothetical protein
MTLDLRSNVVKQKYTFEVVYRDDRPNEIITVEAESVDSAALKLPEDRFFTILIEESRTGGTSNG